MTARRHTFILGRDQRVDVRDTNGELRMIADHPLNSLLMGVGSETRLVRGAEFEVAPGDRTLVFFAAKAGKEMRAASAVVMQRTDGVLLITAWHVEPGFAHRRELAEGKIRHSIVASRPASAIKSAGSSAAAPAFVSVFRKELQ